MFELSCPDFSLAVTLESGQAFRWTAKNGAYYGFIGSSAVRVRQQDATLLVETVDTRLTEAAARAYFALDHGDLPWQIQLRPLWDRGQHHALGAGVGRPPDD